MSRKFEKEEISCSFFPLLLTPDQKHQRPASPVLFVEMIDDDRNVLKRIVTGDGNRCFMYDPQTKCQRATWLSSK
jgi:hypothetical protein